MTSAATTDKFWQKKPLNELTREEWESLCDGCAKCCLHKLEDEETDEVFYTKVVCRYMDAKNCRCTVYEKRTDLVPNCVRLQPDDVPVFHWLPSTCAYRLVAEGKPLEWWHPLISGSKDTVHEAGISIKGRSLSEEFVHPDGWDEHIITWVE